MCFCRYCTFIISSTEDKHLNHQQFRFSTERTAPFEDLVSGDQTEQHLQSSVDSKYHYLGQDVESDTANIPGLDQNVNFTLRNNPILITS